MNVGMDYLAENTLEKLSPEYHKRYSECVAAAESLLNRYLINFPTFTDHSLLHSMEVANAANYLISNRISALCAEELYVLLMAALLHDVGMGYNAETLQKRCVPGYAEYIKQHPGKNAQDFIRVHHHELGALFVLENWERCFIPDKTFAAVIAEVGKGHRKTDLMDRSLYPACLKLGGGTVNMAYLAAVIRLADELDFSAERNLLLQYAGFVMGNQNDVIEFQKHSLLHSVFSGDTVVVKGETNSIKVFGELTEVCDKVQETLGYCQNIVRDCTGGVLPVRSIVNEIRFIGGDVALTLEYEREGDTLTIALIGNLDATTSPLLDKILANTLNGGAKNLVLDFKLLGYISSAGLRVILGAKKKTMALTGNLSLINISPEVMKILRITGFDAVFDLKAT
jgi:anti-anti-sigma factor